MKKTLLSYQIAFKATSNLKYLANLVDYEDSVLPSYSRMRVHKLLKLEGERLGNCNSPEISDWLHHEERVKSVIGHLQYQAMLVAADNDSLDHEAILEIARQMDRSGLVCGTLR